ncbi:hypothetical protein RhiJN_09360 [Ceratobasidium sp. AG-Ba]|nr:hypothetical protein RhiJN_09360 [Ceratobasidium sp. AG-Ba]
MQFLAHSRARVEHLDLFPSREAYKYTSDRENILRQFLPGKTKDYYEYLPQFDSITHLNGTLGWFEKEPFPELGRLPHLRSIHLYMDEDTTGPYPDLDSLISEDSFPFLDELKIDRPFIDQLLGVLVNQSFVKRLNTLILGILDEYFGFDSIHGVWELEEYSFSSLWENLSNLKHLEIAVYKPAVLLPLDSTVIGNLLNLPLQTLTLRGVEIQDLHVATEEMSVLWPELTELIIPDCLIDLADISIYALIPNLSYIELALNLRSPQELKHTRRLTPVKSLEVIRSSARASYMCSSQKDMDLVIRSLLTVWPGLKRIEWELDTKDELTLALYKQLNEKLDASRQPGSLNSA